jgi:hypothetical protein
MRGVNWLPTNELNTRKFSEGKQKKAKKKKNLNNQ